MKTFLLLVLKTSRDYFNGESFPFWQGSHSGQSLASAIEGASLDLKIDKNALTEHLFSYLPMLSENGIAFLDETLT